MKAKRIVSLVLVVTSFVTLLPTAAFAEPAEAGPTVWEARRIEDLTVEEMGEGVIYAGTAGGNAKEKGQYVITLFRDGYSDEAATVELHTVDVSAKIGVDYQIIGEDTTYTGIEGTVIERNANYDAEETVRQFSDEVTSIQQELSEESDEEPVLREKSALARIKEEQTGMETREIIENSDNATTNIAESVVQMITPEQEEVSGMLNEYAADNLGEFIESTSVSLITFAPGETQKQITIEISEDEEAEADEIVYLFLSGADGAVLGDLNSVTVTIRDDEKKEPAFVGLSDDFYRFDGDENHIVLVRTGAVYDIVSADVRLEDGSVQTVMFKPYETEKAVFFDVSGSGSVNVKLENFKGCEEGEITEAKAVFGDEELFAPFGIRSANSEAELYSASETLSFNLTGLKSHNGYSDLRVDYVPGQLDENGYLYGKIYDTGYYPEVHVGNYYFPENFDYNKYTGHSDATEKQSYYGYSERNKATEPGGYGHLYWYDWYTRNKGTSYARITDINHSLYEYYAVDWHQSLTTYGGQKSRLKAFSSSNDERSEYKEGAFSRTVTSLTSLGTDGMPQGDGGYLEVHAEDSNSNRTPKVSLYFYGIAAMFRRFNISVNQPVRMSFLGSGNTTESRVPANVSIGEGHSLRYTEQSLAVKQNSAYQSGIIPGELIGYKIETNYKDSEPENRKVFYYMANGKKPQDAVGSHSGTYYNAPKGTNMESIYFGNDFITDMIDKNLVEISGSGTNWTTDLAFTPIYQYKDAVVQIISNANGEFEGLKEGATYYGYNIGDTLTLMGKPDNDSWVYAGYKVTGRATANMNETPLINETVWSDDGTQLTLLLGEKNCTHYQVEPIFKKRQGNYITINNLSDKDVTIKNLLSTDELRILMEAYSDYEFDENQKIYVVNAAAEGKTEAERILNSITVKAGEIYQIYAEGRKSGDDYFKPTFYNEHFSSHKVNSEVYDYIASGDLSENIITVSSAHRKLSDEEYIEITGKIESKEYSIRQSAATMENVGIENLSVEAGDRGYVDMWITSGGETKKIKKLERATDITDENGGFVLSGIKGLNSDTVTLYYNNGDIKGVRVINLSEVSDTGKQCEMEFMTAVTDDENKANSETSVMASGRQYNLEESDNSYYNSITTPVFTEGSPYPVSIDYMYFSGSNVETFGTNGNSIAIVDDNLTLTLKIDRKGHQISKVVFTLDKQRGADQAYEVEGKINGDTYACDFGGKSMKDILDPGDRIYVTLYDAEQREVSFVTTDEEGNELVAVTKENIVYNKIFTGLTCYVPMLEVVPQAFEVPETIKTEVPILGEMMGKASSGVVSFSMQKWEENEGGIDGFSVVFDANINAWNRNGVVTPSQELLKKVKTQKNDAKERAAMEFADKEMDDGDNIDDVFSLEKTQEYYDSFYKKSLSDMFSKPIMKVNVIVLLNFDFVYSEEKGEYVNTGGQVVFGGTFDVKYTFYWVVYGVPIYLQLAGNLGAEIQANYGGTAGLGYNKFKTYENIYDAISGGDDDVGLFVRLVGKVSIGVGICGVLSARGIVEVDARAFASFMDIENNSGIIGAIQGGFGVDLVVFSFEYTVGYQIGCGIYEKDSGWLTALDDENVKLAADEAEVKLEDVRVYAAGDGSQVGTKTTQENGYEILLESAPERTKPQVVTLDDGKKLLVYIGSSSDRALQANKSCLYYSVYENGKWGEAKAIEADGTADGTPAVSRYGDKVIVAWADAAREFSAKELENGQYKEILSEFDISASVFDSQTGTFGEVLRVSNDEANYDGAKFLDYAPVISADKNGELGAAVFYIKRDIQSAQSTEELIASTAVYETIALTVVNNDREVLAEQFMAVEGDPLMFKLDSAMTTLKVGGEEHAFAICTYTADRDNDLTDSSDWDVYLLFHDITADKTYEPINLCNDFAADSAPQLTRINDSIYLTYVTNKADSVSDRMINVLNYMSVTDMLELMQYGSELDESGVREWNIDMEDILADSGDNTPWYHKTAAQLGLSDEVYKDSIFAQMCENDFPISSTDMQLSDNQTASIGSYQLTEGKDGKVYLLWIDSGSTDPKDYSVELYGAVNNVNAEEGEVSGWSKPVRLTRFSDSIDNSVIDEFSVAVDKDGMFTLVSNMFTQNLEDGIVEYSPNKLIAFTIDERGELIFDSGEIIFGSKYPKAGEETEVTFSLRNDGLQSIKVSKATITVDGADPVTVEINTTLLGGESTTVDASLVMPDAITDATGIKVTAETEDGQSVAIEDVVPYGTELAFETKELSRNQDGTINYTTEITNVGNKPSGEFSLDIQRVVNGEGVVGGVSETAVKSIAVGASAECSVTLNADTLSMENFDEYGIAELSITANQNDTEISDDVLRIGKKMVREAYPNGDEETNNPGGTFGGGIITDRTDTPEDSDPVEPLKWQNPFTDVKEGDWFYEDVRYANENDLMVGTTGTTFDPQSNLTRGMLVTILHRAEGEPSVGDDAHIVPPFADVDMGAYYADAVIWAEQNGIVKGMSETEFAPDQNITREQIAAIMHRYAQYKGYDVSAGENTNILSYDDFAEISEYAIVSMQYAVGSGLMKGKSETTLNPKNNATRAEIAAVLHRFIEGNK